MAFTLTVTHKSGKEFFRLCTLCFHFPPIGGWANWAFFQFAAPIQKKTTPLILKISRLALPHCSGGFSRKWCWLIKLAVFVNSVYDMPRAFSAPELTVATVAFGFQIFAIFPLIPISPVVQPRCLASHWCRISTGHISLFRSRIFGAAGIFRFPLGAIDAQRYDIRHILGLTAFMLIMSIVTILV